MNALSELRDLGFRVGWRTALLGWDGPADNERQIAGSQVVQMALENLTRSPDSSGAIVDLASLPGNEIADVDRLLRYLAHQENSSDVLELRKWRVFLLHERLARLPDDPLYAWVSLADFWRSFGHPGDSPEIVRGFERIDQAQRYTARMRRQLLADHLEWLNTERAAILAAEEA